MKICWLNQKDNPDCILFMAGWGMVPEPFSHMVFGSVDILMAYDYRTVDEADFSALLNAVQLKRHRKIHLLAWSMGVWVTAMLWRDSSFANLPFSSTTAIGGTCQPIHDQFGIPEQVFDRTARELSPAVLEDFYRSMFDSDTEADLFLGHVAKTNRSVEELRRELVALRRFCTDLPDLASSSDSTAGTSIFANRIVTSRDRVFPVRNQVRAWGRKTCTPLPLPHFPFYQWSSWAEMLKRLI